MKKTILTLSLIGTCLWASTALCASEINTSFIDSKGKNIGTATLMPMENGTLITVDLKLPPGPHAIHIHQKAACDAPDFKTAGGHYNPEDHKHGFNSAEGFHAGDLPNLYVEKTGHIKAEMFSTEIHLTDDSLSQGAALIVHEKADDYSSDPSGNSGARIACATLKL